MKMVEFKESIYKVGFGEMGTSGEDYAGVKLFTTHPEALEYYAKLEDELKEGVKNEEVSEDAFVKLEHVNSGEVEEYLSAFDLYNDKLREARLKG